MFRSRDPSTNLNGAVLLALDRLDAAITASSVPLRFGSLVVFTDGTDHAARVPLEDMLHAVDAAPFDVYAISVGDEIDDRTLSRIGKSGNIRIEDSSAWATAFHDIGERILRAGRRFYLLSYCTLELRAHTWATRTQTDASLVEQWMRAQLVEKRLRSHARKLTKLGDEVCLVEVAAIGGDVRPTPVVVLARAA
jgi:hypothetical protein